MPSLFKPKKLFKSLTPTSSKLSLALSETWSRSSKSASTSSSSLARYSSLPEQHLPEVIVTPPEEAKSLRSTSSTETLKASTIRRSDEIRTIAPEPKEVRIDLSQSKGKGKEGEREPDKETDKDYRKEQRREHVQVQGKEKGKEPVRDPVKERGGAKANDGHNGGKKRPRRWKLSMGKPPKEDERAMMQWREAMYSPPSERRMTKAAETIILLDGAGKNVRFPQIYCRSMTICVFIRHFFNKEDQAYVAQLGQLPLETLLDQDIRVVVIGCGDWMPIAAYAETTRFGGVILTDPTRELYKILQMHSEPDPNDKPKPQKTGRTIPHFANNMISVLKGPLKHPSLVGKEGDHSQLGGEFIFAPDDDCKLAMRMESHRSRRVRIPDLVRMAGFEYPTF